MFIIHITVTLLYNQLAMQLPSSLVWSFRSPVLHRVGKWICSYVHACTCIYSYVHMYVWQLLKQPSKNALARSYKKRYFFLHSCKILLDLAGFCGNLAGILCKIPAKSCQIMQDLARSCRDGRKRTFSCKILEECFYWEGLLDWRWTRTFMCFLWFCALLSTFIYCFVEW